MTTERPSPIDLRLGRWQDVLADVGEVDAVITDPPYSERTHGAKYSAADGSDRTWLEAAYSHWTPRDVEAFVASWVPRCRGWFVAMTSHDLAPAYEAALEASGRYVFAPVAVVLKGSNVRLAGDGPSNWARYAVVARPRSSSFARWGALPGAYVGPPGEMVVTGGKPLWLMQALVADYTRPGDLVVDPCAGGATTLLAAAIEGRRAIGAELDPGTFAKAQARIAKGYTPSLIRDRATEPEQLKLG